MIINLVRKKTKAAIKALLVCAALFSAQSYAYSNFYFQPDFNLKLGGWSDHKPEDFDNFSYNESHQGIGFDASIFKSRNGRHSFGVGYFKMTDSFEMDSEQVGIIYKYDPQWRLPVLRGLEFNMSLSHMRRGWIYRSESDYNDYVLEYNSTIAPLPYITYNFNSFFNVDFFYIPQIEKEMPEQTWFIRGGINLSKLSGLGNSRRLTIF